MKLTLTLISTLLIQACATKTLVHHCNPVSPLLDDDKSDDWVCEKYWWSR